MAGGFVNGVIVRHKCGRLIFDGQRCICDPVKPFVCDCTADGNDEHEGVGCRIQRRKAWGRIFNWSRDQALQPDGCEVCS